MSNKIIDVEYVSIWNGGFEVTTMAKFNESTGEVFDIEGSGIEVDADGDELEFLDGEKIVFKGGLEKEVQTSENGKYYVVD